jgi:hypothetical protein
MGLNEFPDTLLPVILHFGGAIGEKSPCGEFSLIRRCRFFYFAFDERLLTSFSSRPGHGRDLSKQFPESS